MADVRSRLVLACGASLALAALLAACSSGSKSTPTPPSHATATPTPAPSGTGSATATPTPKPTGTPTGSATATPTPGATSTPGTGLTYTFPAATQTTLTLTANQTPQPVTLPAYHNITVVGQFGPPSVTGSLVFSDGLNNGDITPAVPADNASAATPIIYMSVYNGGSSDISFGTQIPQLTLTDTAGFGSNTSCEFDSYNSGTWKTLLTATVSGSSVTFGPESIPGNTVDFAATNQSIVAFACS
jgi:hypothetical protein